MPKPKTKSVSALVEEANARYRQLVIEAARADGEVDPNEVLKTCFAAGRSLAQFERDVERVEGRIEQAAAFDTPDLDREIEEWKRRKAETLERIEPASRAVEEAKEAHQRAKEAYTRAVNRTGDLHDRRERDRRVAKNFLRATAAPDASDPLDPLAFALTE